MTDIDGPTDDQDVDLAAILGVPVADLVAPVDDEVFDAMIDRAVDPDTPPVSESIVPGDLGSAAGESLEVDVSAWQDGDEVLGDDAGGFVDEVIVEEDGFDGPDSATGFDGGLL